VDGLDEIFDAAETLTRTRLVGGDRLLILTNGGGPGVMATDALIAAGGRLADLPDELRRELDAVLPPTWSRANPVDIVGDAPASRFTDALRVLLAKPPGDALLVMNSPTAVVPGDEAARAVAEAVAAAGSQPIVLASWLGGESVEGGRRLLREAGIATFDTPGDAVRAFLHMVAYRRNQDQLMEVPPALPADFEVHPAAAREVIEKAAGAGREWLSEPESKQVLAAYGIPVVPTRHATSADEAVRLAAEMGLPVALKILSPQVTHKTEVGGVALDLETPEAVRAAAGAMAGRLRQLRPEAQLEGFAVQPMARRPGAHELILGAATDAVFGPVLLFGHGGTGVEVIGDRAVGLPPLNLALARDLVSRTRVARLLDGYRGRPAADRAALELALVRLSQLLVDLPEVLEVDVNPLLADEKGVLALDARLRVAPPGSRRAPLAVRPYPGALEENLELPGGRRVFVRPIRPEDEPSHRRFFERLAPSDVYFRFFSMVRRMPHSQLARFTQIDYDREMAFIALDAPAGAETLGVVRVVCDPDNTRGEFAIVVRSDLKGRGLGHALLEKMIRYCRERRTGKLVGQVLPDNRAMLALAAELGFESRYDTEGGVVEVELPLSPAPAG
jgi:acetyltransferase